MLIHNWNITPADGGLTWLRRLFCVAGLLATSTVGTASPTSGAEFSDPEWNYTFEQPAEDWFQPNFDSSGWEVGKGGFGTPETPSSRVGTLWRGKDIWLRRTITIDTLPEAPALFVYHDDNAEVYINGQLVKQFERWVTNYQVFPLEGKSKAALKTGENLIAVHCHQDAGGQFIDVHVIDSENVPTLPVPNRPERPFITALTTPWGDEVNAENAWREYPRPQLQRDDWTNLNGMWDYAITPLDQTQPPTQWDGKILVPYPLESKLSGVQKLLDPDEALWYRTTLRFYPQANSRQLLNFEAVDYDSQVWVNGKLVGSHVGGNLPFSFDVTSAIHDGNNDIVVRVEDATEGFQLRGKQTLNPGGIWYTQASGIWQTVWLEEVSQNHISELDFATDINKGTITVTPTFNSQQTKNLRWEFDVQDEGQVVASADGQEDSLQVQLSEPILWSPDNPHLYTLEIRLLDDQGNVIDRVHSYVGIRSVGRAKDADGHWRFTLNEKPIFHWGPLDQGWWPDGLLTPPSDEAIVFEIDYLKNAGFNMIRKHIKVEPRRYYYHCDRIGMMVWQDQVSGGISPPWTRMDPNPTDAHWPNRYHQQFMNELEAMVDSLETHPCIVAWVPFNEAWGQHRTVEVGKWIEKRDPTRLINIASGGNFWPVGDIADHHNYPHPDFPFDKQRYADYVLVVGEFGGHGLPIKGHLYDPDRDNWGYGGLPKNAGEYEQRYRESMRRLIELKKQGIAGAVYTQTTDVEIEINGLMTYDRRQLKLSADELRRISAPLLAK